MAIERIVPGTIEWDAFYANHIIRYQFAATTLQQNNQLHKLLDAACGVGYGSKFLAQQFSNAQITAIDRSKEALSIANSKFASATINFIEDDCHTLAAAATAAPFDAIVSFETLEHLPKPEAFLKSCFNVLASNGTLIVSTPNQLVSSPTELNWEYHEKEYTPSELLTILQTAGFTNIQLWGQQFNVKGKIKNEVRADINKLWSNPFARFGRWIQTLLRGRKFEAVLKETIDDFEIVRFNSTQEIDAMGVQGPFVLIAVAQKN
jgi:ubiquinone/menaquinone biosynthesis C-methylase UbiE